MKYDIGFKFMGVDPNFLSEEHVISCKVTKFDGQFIHVEWTAVSDKPSNWARTGTWLTDSIGIDSYIKGYEIYNSPLFQALREDDEV